MSLSDIEISQPERNLPTRTVEAEIHFLSCPKLNYQIDLCIELAKLVKPKKFSDCDSFENLNLKPSPTTFIDHNVHRIKNVNKMCIGK